MLELGQLLRQRNARKRKQKHSYRETQFLRQSCFPLFFKSSAKPGEGVQARNASTFARPTSTKKCGGGARNKTMRGSNCFGCIACLVGLGFDDAVFIYSANIFIFLDSH